MIRLYHYSNKDFKGSIKPCFFGENKFSGNSRRLSEVKRAYFYLEPSNKEYYFNGSKYLYIAEVSENRLYNLNIDKKGIVKRLKNTQDIYSEVKKRGYIGLIGSNGLPCVVLFKAIKIKQRKTLTEPGIYAIL